MTRVPVLEAPTIRPTNTAISSADRMDVQQVFFQVMSLMAGPFDQYEIYWREILLVGIGLLMFFIAGTLWNLRGLYRRVLEQEDRDPATFRPSDDLAGEVERLRSEVDNLRNEVLRMGRNRVLALGYSDAAELARKGAAPQSIAAQCEISLAEAELVQSMNRAQANAR